MRIEAVYGVLIPLLGTTLGAACVFFMRKKSGWKSLSASETGRLGGVMNRKIRQRNQKEK